MKLPSYSAILTALVLAAAAPAWQAVHAQSPAQAPLSAQAAAYRHADGLMLEHRGMEQEAFIAFVEAAEAGHGPAQRRLGEIYDSGNSAVKRDYEESIRWTQKAREGGEEIPRLKSPMPSLSNFP